MNHDVGASDQGKRSRWPQPRQFISLVHEAKRRAQQERAERNYRDTNDARLQRYTKQLRNATWAIFAAGILTFGAAILQWDVIRGADKTTREGFSIVQRAFIIVTGLTLSEVSADGKVVGWYAVPIVENKGNTAAIEVKMKLIQTPALWGQLTSHNIFFDPVGIPNPISEVHESTGMVPPQSVWDGVWGGANVARGRSQPPKDNEKWVDFIWGVVRYNDVLPNTKEHITEYCFLVGNPDVSRITERPSPHRCTYHNCTDDQCENERPMPETRARNYEVRGALPRLDTFGEGFPFPHP